MQTGDLVKYKHVRVPRWPSLKAPGSQETFGIVIKVRTYFHTGGGGAWPSSETRAEISWSNLSGVWITEERVEDLEVVNEAT